MIPPRRLKAVLAVVLLGLGVAHAAGAQTPPSPWLPEVWVDGWQEGQIDAATLAALDDLLRDPVDLRHGDAWRLAVIPGVEREALEALHAAMPLRRPNDLATLPGWSPALAGRVAPFVTWTAVSPAAPRAARATHRLRLRRLQRFRDARVDVRMPSLQARGVWQSEQPGRPARARRVPRGFLAHEARRWRAVGGHLRVTHAQGLLVWSGLRGTGAPAPVVWRPRGLQGTEAHADAHRVAGAGIEAWWPRARATVALGRTPVGEAWALAAAGLRRARAWQVEAAVLQRGAFAGVSLSWRLQQSRRTWVAESVWHDGRLAVATGFEWRASSWDLGWSARLAPAATLPAGSRLGAVRRALATRAVRVRWTHRGRGHPRLEWFEEALRGAGVRERRRVERFELRDRGAGWRTSAYVQRSTVDASEIDIEAAGVAQRVARHTWKVAGARTLAPGFEARMEWRGVRRDAGVTATGQAWLLGLRVGTVVGALHLVLSGARATSPLASPRVGVPGIEAAAFTRTLSDGALLWALHWRLDGVGLRAEAAASRGRARRGALPPRWEVALHWIGARPGRGEEF